MASLRNLWTASGLTLGATTVPTTIRWYTIGDHAVSEMFNSTLLGLCHGSPGYFFCTPVYFCNTQVFFGLGQYQKHLSRSQQLNTTNWMDSSLEAKALNISFSLWPWIKKQFPCIGNIQLNHVPVWNAYKHYIYHNLCMTFLLRHHILDNTTQVSTFAVWNWIPGRTRHHV